MQIVQTQFRRRKKRRLSRVNTVCLQEFACQILSRELKTLHLKSGIQGFQNKTIALIFIFKATYITRLPFVLSFLRIFYVQFVTSHVASFFKEVLVVIAEFLEKRVL